MYFWQVRVLLSLFPPFLVENFQKFVAPIGGGTIAAMMVGKLDVHANTHAHIHVHIRMQTHQGKSRGFTTWKDLSSRMII